MACFSVLGIGLSFVFGCIFLGVVAEVYYVLWWKKKRDTSRGIEDQYCIKQILHLSFWKKPSSKTQQLTNSVIKPDATYIPESDLELGPTKDLLPKGIGEESVEAELIRLHNLCGPPRFLFTINEETKEDMESNCGRSRKGSRTRSLSDFFVSIETPVLTPLASPTMKDTYPSNSYNGFNPLFDLFSQAEINRLRSSPPPKFKFLRDAEEKLMRKLKEVEKGPVQYSTVKAHLTSNLATEGREGSLIRVIVGKSKEKEATGSQVLPLPSPLQDSDPLITNPIQQ